jgi:hypothetical protein
MLQIEQAGQVILEVMGVMVLPEIKAMLNLVISLEAVVGQLLMELLDLAQMDK